MTCRGMLEERHPLLQMRQSEPGYQPGKLSWEKGDCLLRFSGWLGINNEPRAIVWLAGRFSATLVRVRHLMF